MRAPVAGPGSVQAVGAGASFVRRVGGVCWAVVGIVVVVAILCSALAVVSEVVLPLVFGVVLAVLFTPLCRRLQRRHLSRTMASLAIVSVLVVAACAAVLLAASAVAHELGTWSDSLDVAVGDVADSADVDESTVEQVRHALAAGVALVVGGVAAALISSVATLLGFLAGTVLGVLILYYLLKDGEQARARFLGVFPDGAQADVDALVARSIRTVRAYGAARTVLSAMVATVITAWAALLGLPLLLTIALVNFLGGYIPYLGAIAGGFVAVVLALTEVGVGAAVATLIVVLLANLALENLVEPRVMGNRLSIHPLVVLVVTTAGGIVGGMVGLILAVPLFVVGMDAAATFRRHVLEPSPHDLA